MRNLSGALLIGIAIELLPIAPPSSAQYLGVPYYGQPPPYTSTQQTPTYGTRETPSHRTRHATHHHHHGKSQAHNASHAGRGYGGN